MDPHDKLQPQPPDIKAGKKPYGKPVVHVYGNLTDLTETVKGKGKKDATPNQQPGSKT